MKNFNDSKRNLQSVHCHLEGVGVGVSGKDETPTPTSTPSRKREVINQTDFPWLMLDLRWLPGDEQEFSQEFEADWIFSLQFYQNGCISFALMTFHKHT
jgi:hypothetical protein